MKRKIGIGGSIASGKSTLSRIIREAGCIVIDADQVARQVVEPGTVGYLRVKDQFPEAFDGEVLNRKKLGQIIFHDEAKRLQLNQLLHPLITDESRRQLAEGGDLVFLEAPLLFESELLGDFDLTIYVTANREVQIKRLMKRDQISREYAETKLSTFHEPSVLPSIILTNNGSIEEFEASSKALLARIISD